MKMARKPLMMMLVVLCASISYAQTTRRVNNTGIALGPNMYAKLQEAHNASVDGDIIYVEGSGTKYDNLICSKKLTIIGPGYLLGENYTYFADLRAATLGSVQFDPGSSGSSLIGSSNAVVVIKTSNVTIARNFEPYVSITPDVAVTGIVIHKNYGAQITSTSYYNISALISNNHIKSCDLSANYNSGTYSNNLIVSSTYLNNFNVINNISLANGPMNFTNCTMNNNIDAKALANSTVFGTTNGNLGNVDKTKLFVGTPPNSTDGQWKLKAGSVAIAAGFNGADCGIYGGTNPYEVSGVSSLDYPAVTSFTTSGSGSSTTPLNVTISTKSN